MFMESGEEAKALYFAYKGKSLPEADNQLWEQAVAEDFAKLRKAGLTHPMMADVEKELGVSRCDSSVIARRHLSDGRGRRVSASCRCKIRDRRRHEPSHHRIDGRPGGLRV
jgi:hypothetical protein